MRFEFVETDAFMHACCSLMDTGDCERPVWCDEFTWDLVEPRAREWFHEWKRRQN